MLIVGLFLVLVLVILVAIATIVAVVRDGYGRIAENPAHDTRRPLR